MAAPVVVSSGIRAHLRVPVLRAGYALVASSVASSALGAVYWFIAARRYDTESVGIGSALVAVTTLLAGIANLGLKNGLMRFVPQAGRETGRLIKRSYGLSAACAGVAGVIFLLGVRVWSPDLLFLRNGVLPCAVFLATLVAWAIFVIQDSVLVGLGRAMWVPVENVAFSIAKIAMLLGLVYASPRWGVFLSWGVPTVALIAVVNWAIAHLWLAPHEASERNDEPPTFTRVLRFSLADQAATLLWMATLDGLPLLVLRRAGGTAAAYYYLSAQIAYGLYFLSGCIGAALVAEAAREPRSLAELNRRVSRQTFGLVVPATAAVVIAAPWILRIFGPAYEHNATSLLRLLALSAIPYSVTSIALSLARVRQRMGVVVAGHTGIFVLCVGSAALLQSHSGLTGIGVGVLLGQTMVATAVICVALLPVIRLLRAALITHLAHAHSWVRHAKVGRRLEARLSALNLSPDLWTGPARLLSAHNDVTVAELMGRHGPVVVKMATGRGARFGLIDHVRALTTLHGDPALRVLAPVLPHVVKEGTANGSRYLVETSCHGTANSDAFLDPTRRPAALRALGPFIAQLHIQTARETEIDEELLQSWVGRPLQVMTAAAGRTSTAFRRGSAALAEELRVVLLGRRVDIARVHGDLSPGNVLLDGRGRTVTGLVDWENSRRDGLPGVDLATFVLALRRERTGAELGELVLEAAGNPTKLDPDESAFLEPGTRAETGLSARHLFLLAWLAHVESNLVKSERYRNSRRWLRRNVIAVVEGLSVAPLAAARPVSVGAAGLHRRPSPVRFPHPLKRTREVIAFAWPARVEAAPRHRRPSSARFPRALEQTRVAVGGLGTLAVLGGAAVVWLWSLTRVDVRSMTDVGLVSVMPLLAWAAVGSILIAVVHALTRPSLPERRLLVLLSGYIVMIHATAPLLYRTLRYSWAWKHVGIVDYLGRIGSVNPHIRALNVYHNWPGFFSANAVLVNLIGTKNAIVFAMWTPVIVNLLDLAALLFLLPTLSADRRVVWTAAWLFFLANWVGQDYFSPQAMAYFVHLVILALLLTHFRRRQPHADGHERKVRGTGVDRTTKRRVATGAGLVIFALALTTTSSHQLTPAMTLIVMGLLVVSRRTRAAWVLLAVFVGQALWLLGPARTFVAKNVKSILQSFGAPVENAGATLRDTTRQSPGQALVSLSGRGVVALVAVLAVAGVVVRLRRGHRDGTALILLCSPALLIMANEFGGEILFRAYLFSMPFLALFAAWALLPPPSAVLGRLHTVALASVSFALFGGFMLAHFGKDRYFHFTTEEVAAATFLARNAVAPTLLIEGNRNYPAQFLNYERFVYVPIDQEPPDGVRSVLADPAGRLEEWAADPRFADAFVLITRSQKADVAAEGGLPAGALDRVERALRTSPKFTVVFQNRDATVFTLVRRQVTP